MPGAHLGPRQSCRARLVSSAKRLSASMAAPPEPAFRKVAELRVWNCCRVVPRGIALLVFGPKKLPELGKGIGEGIRGFKAAMKEKEQVAAEPIKAQAVEAEVKG